MNEIVPARNIGSYVPMIDGPEKVSGRAKYTADLIAPGMLAGRIYRSPCSHAEILEVDVADALRLPGVKAIVVSLVRPDESCQRTFRLSTPQLPLVRRAKKR